MAKRKLYDKKLVMEEVANLLYVIGDVREGEYTAHTLHNTFDICAPGNIDRAHKTLDLAVAQVETLVYSGSGSCSSGFSGSGFSSSGSGSYGSGSCSSGCSGSGRVGAVGIGRGVVGGWDLLQWRLVSRLVHEYLVAKVVADWLEVAFPPITAHTTGTVSIRVTDSVVSVWKEKAATALSELTDAVRTIASGPSAFGRRVPPI